MVNDHLSDFVARLRNAYSAKKETLDVPLVKTVEAFSNVLMELGYVENVSKKERELPMKLVYKKAGPAMMGISRVSKPGARIYIGYTDLPRVWGGLGSNILSTPHGIISEKKAKSLKSGGELLAQIW